MLEIKSEQITKTILPCTIMFVAKVVHWLIISVLRSCHVQIKLEYSMSPM